MGTVRYFFHLQAKRMHRTISDWGIHPLVVYIGLPILFVAGAIALFIRTPYAPWIYAGIAALALLQWCGVERQRFLRQVFDRQTYWRIRLLENVLLMMPFAAFLLYKGEWWFAVGLLVLAAVAVPVRIGNTGGKTLPTPFSGKPFEFTIGFRASVGMLLLAYLLLVIGIYVNNENLSIATIVLMVLVCANYYGWSEPVLYAWIYALTPRVFLGMKIKTAFRQVSLLLLPMVVVAAIGFSGSWLALLIVLVVGYGYLALAVLAKYAAFPGSVNIPQGIFMALSLMLPPLLLVSIPYFYHKAMANMATVIRPR
ncbi:hypothetical protein SAMN05421740_103197 [Parapedobacter koreensis]|uniref:Uncharacterized protein n=2 Tax=Parapedobacter koreensis TaxID=332977 RepID=A0A1H7LKS5_9SPHI|nr:hypothetical protein SAMN05421740_103197 [Parapedobacter koreensis]